MALLSKKHRHEDDDGMVTCLLGRGSSASLPSSTASSSSAFRARFWGFPGPDVLALLDMTILGTEAKEFRGRLETETKRVSKLLSLSQQKMKNSCPECKPAIPTAEHWTVTFVGFRKMKASRVSKPEHFGKLAN